MTIEDLQKELVRNGFKKEQSRILEDFGRWACIYGGGEFRVCVWGDQKGTVCVQLQDGVDIVSIYSGTKYDLAAKVAYDCCQFLHSVRKTLGL